MTIFDVVAFKMVTALASSTAAVTAADWSAVVDAMQEIILLFAEVVKAAIPFVTVFFFGGYIVRGFCSAAFTGRFKL